MIRKSPWIALLLIAGRAEAEPTKITVRVISQDAKFVGDAMGGARVILRDARSRKILASGVTAGGTGDTRLIMDSRGRSPIRATPEAASFTTTIDIVEPTKVKLEVEGPLNRPGSIIHASAERWIMPGQATDLGNGWMIELPGLAITPDSTQEGQTLSIKANVELMCGCPITPGGLWDAAEYRVEASIWRGRRQVNATPLAFVTSPGGFSVKMPAPGPGRYRLVVFAQNAKTGNSGYHQSTISVR
ncbi:hypothetical protein [Sphingomonas sp.]|uniref:hypothetical protein n=1 Tax=Sphingomonas sp. TaxID=28214 RepID=UPI000BCFC514|nr:MAG: hypothetical protein B7Z43_09670 [Sphingomonas sp. 12-62-6]